jgi:hypothetical protein
MQALISTYSKSPHFDPNKPEAHISTTRDEVGLIRAIAVKVSLLFFEFDSAQTIGISQQKSSAK